MTSEWNSIILLLILFIVLTRDFGLTTDQFGEVVYGDDFVLGLKKFGITVEDLIPHVKRRFNMNLTHWTKKTDHEPDTLANVSFIGRRFSRDSFGIFRAPLALDTICESAYWQRSDETERQMIAVSHTIFMELSHHPRAVFDKYSNLYLDQVKENLPDMYEAICSFKRPYMEYYSKMYHQGGITPTWLNTVQCASVEPLLPGLLPLDLGRFYNRPDPDVRTRNTQRVPFDVLAEINRLAQHYPAAQARMYDFANIGIFLALENLQDDARMNIFYFYGELRELLVNAFTDLVMSTNPDAPLYFDDEQFWRDEFELFVRSCPVLQVHSPATDTATMNTVQCGGAEPFDIIGHLEAMTEGLPTLASDYQIHLANMGIQTWLNSHNSNHEDCRLFEIRNDPILMHIMICYFVEYMLIRDVRLNDGRAGYIQWTCAFIYFLYSLPKHKEVNIVQNRQRFDAQTTPDLPATPQEFVHHVMHFVIASTYGRERVCIPEIYGAASAGLLQACMTSLDPVVGGLFAPNGSLNFEFVHAFAEMVMTHFPLRDPLNHDDWEAAFLGCLFGISHEITASNFATNTVQSSSHDQGLSLGGNATANTTNSEFTDRAVNEPGPTQVGDLGAFHDTGPVMDTAVDAKVKQNPYTNVNMESNSMGGSLDRVFNIANLIWGVSSASGVVLGSYYFPQELFNMTYISDKINDFRAFIAGIKFDIRVLASRTAYGKIGVFVYPFCTYYPVNSNTLATFTPQTSLSQRSGNPHILVDASESGAVSITIPFVSPFRYLDLLKYGNGEICRVDVVVWDPLTNTADEITSAQLVITASFIDAQVFLPTDTSSGPTLSLQARRKEKAGSEAETDRLNAEIQEALRFAQLQDELLLEQDADDVVVNEVQMRRYPTAPSVKEAAAKATSVTSSKIVSTPMPTKSGATSTIGGMFNNITETVLTAASLAMLGLSKPTTTNYAQIVTENPNFNMNNGDGIDTLSKVAVSSENAISTAVEVGGINADEMSIAYIASMPMLATRVVMNAGSTTIAVMTTGVETNPVYCDHLKLQFWQWSGSHKVKIYITASLFHNVELVFYLATNAASDWRVCMHRVVQVQGPTELSMLIPFCPQQMAAPTYLFGTANSPYTLYCSVLAFTQSDNSIPNPIYISTYKAAASDFKVQCPRDCSYICQCNPRDDFNEEFDPIAPGVTGYTHTGFVAGEEITTIRQMIHKFTPIAGISTAYDVPIVTSPISATPIMGVNLYRIFYRYWRGSFRVKFFNLKNSAQWQTHMQMYNSNTFMTGYQGLTITAPTMNTSEGEYPYYSPVLFDVTTTTGVWQRYVHKNNGDAEYLFTAAGDDFSFHFLQPPVPGSYSSNVQGTTAGYKGASNWFNP